MMQVQDAPPDAQELSELQLIIERLASGEISKENAEEKFGRIWNEASRETTLQRILSELFPSLFSSR